MTNIIKFLTAGNVDDGKSTLIGRLLHDTNSLYLDQIEEVKKYSGNEFAHNLDFSLFLDGLLSERKQKITIDVAYRYFDYQDKKFIIADAPGHEQYTKNMAVAASNSDIVALLIDATKNIQKQTIRHSKIANLFGIKNIIVAINKMDLVNYDENIFNQIKKDYLAKISDLKFDQVKFVPICSLTGENLTKASKNMSWYQEKTLIDTLLNIKVKINENDEIVRLAIQNVFKYQDQRLYQANLLSGKIKIGDKLSNFAQNNKLTIKELFVSGKKQKIAKKGDSVSFILEENVDLDRGDLILNDQNNLDFRDNLTADIIWFSNKNFDLNANQEVLLKINHQYISAEISEINDLINFEQNIANDKNNSQIAINEIANVKINLAQNIVIDNFKNNKFSASFLLIDKINNETLAGGVI